MLHDRCRCPFRLKDERRHGVHNQLQPDEMDRQQHQRQAGKRRHNGERHDRHVEGYEVEERALDVVEDVAAFADGRDDGGEVVIEQDEIGGSACDISAALSHGDADIGAPQGRRVVDTVTGHGDDGAGAFQAVHDEELLLGADPREDRCPPNPRLAVSFVERDQLVASDRSFIPGATRVGYDRGMSLPRISRAVFVSACLLAASVHLVSAQAVATGHETSAESVASYALSQQMPVDPEVLVGALPNGLRFYVRPNGKPAREAELRLVVRAGSVLEDDDQRGLAHFVEHMEFQGTRHFPGEGITAFLGALGLSVGADANAATGFDETEYLLRVPIEKPSVN